MSKFKLINLIDRIFITCSVFLIVYAWINFYTRNLWVSFTFSLFFTFAIMFVFGYFINKKQTIAKTNKKQTEEINICFYAFKLQPNAQKVELLQNILSKNFKVEATNTKLYYNENNKKTLLILATQYDVLDNNNLLNIVSENSNEKVDEIEIICNEFEPNINCNIFTNKTIKVVNKTQLYLNYFLKYNTFPSTENINTDKQKINIKTIIKEMFAYNKSKRYFFCGLFLIFSSIILPFHFYYLLIGSILLLFALICKILPFVKD